MNNNIITISPTNVITIGAIMLIIGLVMFVAAQVYHMATGSGS